MGIECQGLHREVRLGCQPRYCPAAREFAMPIRILLEHDHAFTPEDVKVLTDAFEDTLRALRLHDREDPLTMAVAKIIIQLAKDGERDPTRLRDLALKAVRWTSNAQYD